VSSRCLALLLPFRADTEGVRRSPEVLIGVVVSLVVILALVAVVLSRGPLTYPDGSPERTLQSYFTAVIAENKAEAFSYFSSESQCTQQDMENSYVPDISRIDIESSKVTGDEASLTVRLEFGGSSIFSGSYSERQTFGLVKESGEWKIADGAWPMYSCGEWVK
jgi:hypothetical protein